MLTLTLFLLKLTFFVKFYNILPYYVKFYTEKNFIIIEENKHQDTYD